MNGRRVGAPTDGTPAAAWPYTAVRHSSIEHRFSNGGKGERGVYLVAELDELARMIQGEGEVTAAEAQKILTRIGDRIEHDIGRNTEPAALAAWRGYVGEMADEEDE